jgi:hypothetical protein
MNFILITLALIFQNRESYAQYIPTKFDFHFPCLLIDRQVKTSNISEAYDQFEYNKLITFMEGSSVWNIRFHVSCSKPFVKEVFGPKRFSALWSWGYPPTGIVQEKEELVMFGYRFLLKRVKEEYCNADGVDSMFHFLLECDTIVSGVYNVNISAITKRYRNWQELRGEALKDMDIFSKIKLLSSPDSELIPDYHYSKKHFEKVAREKTQLDMDWVESILKESRIDNSPIEPGNLFRYADLAKKSNVLYSQGKDKEILKLHYDYIFNNYTKRLPGIDSLFNVNKFSQKDYLMRCQKFMALSYSNDYLLNFLNSSDSLSNFVTNAYIGSLIGKNEQNFFLPNNIDFVMRESGLTEYYLNLAYTSILSSDDANIDIGQVDKFSFEHIEENDSISEHFIYNRFDSNELVGTYYFRFDKNVKTGKWYCSKLELPLESRISYFEETELLNGWLILARKDSSYIVTSYLNNPKDLNKAYTFKILSHPNGSNADYHYDFICNKVGFEVESNVEEPLLWFANWTHYKADRDSLVTSDSLDYNPESVVDYTQWSGRSLLLQSAPPERKLFKRNFRFNDLNHDNIPECYRYSISNGKLIDVDCYTLVNDGPVLVSREQAEGWLMGEFEFRTLLLYSQMIAD